MNRYKTVFKEASAGQIIEKSKFTAHISPVENKGEAEAFIERVKAENKEATHNVPAMVIGEEFQIQWASDDGEPRGTAGAPIVQMLVKEGITNVAVVVTRIFGGIKLGTGGLVRAYTGSAKLGLAAAGVCQVKELALLTVTTEYTHLSKIQAALRDSKFEIRDIRYEELITLELTVEPENEGYLRTLLDNITSGALQHQGRRQELIKSLIKS